MDLDDDGSRGEVLDGTEGATSDLGAQRGQRREDQRVDPADSRGDARADPGRGHDHHEGDGQGAVRAEDETGRCEGDARQDRQLQSPVPPWRGGEDRTPAAPGVRAEQRGQQAQDGGHDDERAARTALDPEHRAGEPDGEADDEVGEAEEHCWHQVSTQEHPELRGAAEEKGTVDGHPSAGSVTQDPQGSDARGGSEERRAAPVRQREAAQSQRHEIGRQMPIYCRYIDEWHTYSLAFRGPGRAV